jgi:hypothetical protein
MNDSARVDMKAVVDNNRENKSGSLILISRLGALTLKTSAPAVPFALTRYQTP